MLQNCRAWILSCTLWINWKRICNAQFLCTGRWCFRPHHWWSSPSVGVTSHLLTHCSMSMPQPLFSYPMASVYLLIQCCTSKKSLPRARRPPRAQGARCKLVCIVALQEISKRERERQEKDQTWCDVKVTTSVYVTGLPDDVTEEELGQVTQPTLNTFLRCPSPALPSCSAWD